MDPALSAFEGKDCIIRTSSQFSLNGCLRPKGVCPVKVRKILRVGVLLEGNTLLTWHIIESITVATQEAA
jgi:hypothetical protein